MFHPGEIIREWWLDGMPADLAAERVGVSREAFERVLSGRESVTPDLARKLEAANWGQAGFWLRLQVRYDRSREGRPGTVESAPLAGSPERAASRA